MSELIEPGVSVVCRLWAMLGDQFGAMFGHDTDVQYVDGSLRRVQWRQRFVCDPALSFLFDAGLSGLRRLFAMLGHQLRTMRRQRPPLRHLDGNVRRLQRRQRRVDDASLSFYVFAGVPIVGRLWPMLGHELRTVQWLFSDLRYWDGKLRWL
jgi:hypothetical protein